MNVFWNNPDFQRYEAALLSLHELLARGEGETPQAETLRDSMDLAYRGLVAVEVERLEQLAVDLNTLIREPEATIDPQARQQLYSYRRQGRWREFLKYLPSADFQDHEKAGLRGRAYDELDHKRAAAMFYARAADIGPPDRFYRGLELHALRQAGDVGTAISRARAVLAAPEIANAVLVIAISLLLDGSDEDRQFAASMKSRLKSTIEQMEPSSATVALGYTTLATIARFEGDEVEADSSWSRLIELNPQDAIAYFGRAQLRYSTGRRQEAYADIWRCINLDCPLMPPYIMAGLQKFRAGDLQSAIALLKHAEHKEAPPRMRARLFELLAICYAELGVSSKTVNRCFNKAKELAPSDERIARNHRTYIEKHEVGALNSLETDAEGDFLSQRTPRDIRELLAA